MSDSFDPRAIEDKWTRRWEAQGTHRTDVQGARRPYYNLMMFPYPSAEGLHVGNVFAFVGSDIHGRYMRARGHDVFQPMGFDAFGIHSENYAIRVGAHPMRLVQENVTNFRERQLKRLGAAFDWSHEVNSADPAYYRWTQWIFVQMLKAGLAYRRTAAVNWCPSCKTVLANEQTTGGVCERCDSPVETRDMLQWFFRITAYADRLRANLDGLDWSEVTTTAQRNWIGPSGARRLRDWCISRQRYWGTPIPVVHCDGCGAVPVPEDQLPVELPYLEDFDPDGSGQSPLARCPEFVNTGCPCCGAPARRETDVADNFLDSAWYFFRYPSSGRDDVPFDPDLTRKWLPVDMYIGGNEHAVLHLMYTRFVTMALQDMGFVEFGEPFQRFRAHGLLIKEGAKMSKSRGNVINPDRYIDEYGADVLRTYLMFLGPYQRGGDFRDTDIIGIRRFYERLWRYVMETPFAESPPTDPALLKLLHSRVRKVTEHIEGLRYNTAVSAIMELLNGLADARKHHRQCARVLVQLVCPFAPFIAHELWEHLGEKGMAGDAPWPSYDPKLVHEAVVELAVQVNGRVRARIAVPVDTPEDEVAQAALAHPRVRDCIAGRPVERTVVVPNRVVSITVAEEAER